MAEFLAVVPASELAGALTELAATAAENERLRTALGDIRDGDQRERLRTVKVDSAGNDYEVEMIDGPWARIARTALAEVGDGDPDPGSAGCTTLSA